jgi:predicted phage tail protein
MERPTQLISFRPSILIMSDSVPALSGIQLTPEIQTLFERILIQKLQERDEYYLGQIQMCEEEMEARRVMHEQEYQKDMAAHQATLESVSHQLEESRVNEMCVLTIIVPSLFIFHCSGMLWTKISLPHISQPLDVPTIKVI